MRRCGCWLALLIVMGVRSWAWAEDGPGIGHVQTLRGTAVVQRAGATMAVTLGMVLQADDVLRTAKDSAVGLVLKDDSTVSLGAESELGIADCTFEPKESRFGLVIRMLKGTFSYISGLIGKLAPDAVRLEIPDGTIAVRGTKLLIDARD